jgi:hypothetical protein
MGKIQRLKVDSWNIDGAGSGKGKKGKNALNWLGHRNQSVAT